MSLINQVQTPTVLDQIKNANTRCLQMMKITAKQTYDLVWKNYKKSPEEVLSILGTDAKSAFIAHEKLQDLIKEIDPNYEKLESNKSITINDDGTVTINVDPS